MGPLARNILAVVVGIILGSAVNMGIVMFGSYVIPPPDGVDVTNMESIKSSMHLFETKHFIVPFLAHALGTLVGAMIAARMAVNNKMKFALGIGAFFFLGGLSNLFMLPSPMWFTILDLGLAYFPMAILGGKLTGK